MSYLAKGTPYEGILKSIKEVVSSLSISDRGGAVGFYDANFDPSGRKYNLCLKLYPLKPELLNKHELQNGQNLATVLDGHFTVERPYDYLFHPKNLEKQSEEIGNKKRVETYEHFIIDQKEEEKARGWEDRVKCDGELEETFLSHLLSCPECSNKVKNKLNRQRGGEYYQLLNDLDIACMGEDAKYADHWLAVPLPFLSSPAALIIIPLKEEAKKEGIKYALDLMERSKPLIQTYVFNRIIQEIGSEEEHLKRVEKREDLARIFLKILIRILIPQTLKWEKADKNNEYFNINEKQEWPLSSDKLLEIDLLKAGRCIVTLPTFFYPDLQSLSGDVEGSYICERSTYHRELASTRQLMENTFEMLLTRWRDAQVQQTRVQAARYKQIKGDLESLIDQVSTMRNTALRIEEQVSPANVGFLRLYDEMKMLFDEGTTLHYGRRGKGEDNTVNKKNQESAIIGPYRREAQLVAQLEDSGSAEVKELHTVHSAENLTRRDIDGRDRDPYQVWNGYVNFLEGKYQDTSISFLDFFEYVEPGENEYASNQFKLLKMLIQRPHVPGEHIYALQILTSCVTQSNITGNEELVSGVRAEIGEQKEVSFDSPKDFIRKVCKDKEYDFSRWLEIRPEPRRTTQYVELASKIRSAEVLEALMRLIGTELQGGKQDVTVKSVTVKSPDGGTKIEVIIKCEGTFDDLSILTDLGPDADEHGLRSCLKTLCESMNRMNPKSMQDANLEKLRVKEERHSHRFMIGENESEECTWFYLAFGSRPEKPKVDPSVSF